MGVAELRKLRQLEEENRKLKQLVAHLSLDKAMLRSDLKKAMKPAQRRQLVLFLRVGFRVSERRAIWALGYNRASMRYQHRKDPQDFLRRRCRRRELAANRPSFGY